MSEARAIYKNGFDHYVNGRREEAIAAFREAIELDPALAIAWNGLSLALGQSGDLAGAVEAAHKLVELEPDDPLSHANLSRLLQQQGLVPEAEAAMAIAGNLELKQQQGDD
jgi:tetratricopeptide (TPR) repeat protein